MHGNAGHSFSLQCRDPICEYTTFIYHFLRWWAFSSITDHIDVNILLPFLACPHGSFPTAYAWDLRVDIVQLH